MIEHIELCETLLLALIPYLQNNRDRALGTQVAEALVKLMDWHGGVTGSLIWDWEMACADAQREIDKRGTSTEKEAKSQDGMF